MTDGNTGVIRKAKTFKFYFIGIGKSNMPIIEAILENIFPIEGSLDKKVFNVGISIKDLLERSQADDELPLFVKKRLLTTKEAMELARMGKTLMIIDIASTSSRSEQKYMIDIICCPAKGNPDSKHYTAEVFADGINITLPSGEKKVISLSEI